MLETNDAALIIGDPAMTFPADQLKIWDLASVWRNYTDLGFVFAMWVVRDDAADVIKSIDFRSARAEGVAHIEEIVSDYAKRIPLQHEELFHYLTRNISYDIDDSMDRGLCLYYQLAAKYHLIDGVKPMRFVGGS